MRCHVFPLVNISFSLSEAWLRDEKAFRNVAKTCLGVKEVTEEAGKGNPERVHRGKRSEGVL